MKTVLIGVPAQNLPDCWESIKHMMDDACSRSGGKYLAVDILRAILRGEMQLWAAIGEEKIEAIAIGEIVNYPRIKVYRLLACTGSDMGEWLEHIHGIEKWAHAMGCADFEAIARPGWERALKDEGYRKTHCILNHSLLVSGVAH